MRRHTFLSVAASLLILAGTAATPARAQEQGLRYTQITKVEFAGSLGAIMSVVPGAPDEIQETVWVQGARMRTDSEDQSTIMDMSEGILYSLDHPNKRYFRFEIGEMAGGLGIMSAGTAREMESSSGQATAGSDPSAEDSVEVTMGIDTERTGETAEIAGMEAERVFMTMTMEATGQDEEANEIHSGTMVVLTELWLAEDVPGMESLNEASREMVLQALGAGGSEQGMAAAYEADPRIRVATEEARDQLEELQGFPVKSVSHFVLVPQGLEFDREKVLESADEPLAMSKGELAAAAGKAVAKSAAKSAAESLTGGMSGLFGRKKEEPEEEEEDVPEPVQTTIMRGTTTITELRTEPIGAELFRVPDDYQETELPRAENAGGPGQP